MMKTSPTPIAAIDDLPTLPQVVIEVNRLMQDPDASLKQVGALIAKDIALAPRILKLVNSSFFGFQSQVSDIARAVVLLGFNTVRSALFSVAVIDALSSRKEDGRFDIRGFWKHSLSVAVIAGFIGGRTGNVKKEDAFTAGLLHDIGKVVLWQHFKERFDVIQEKAAHERLPFHQCEDKDSDFSHAVIGAGLARRWQLPDTLQNAIRFHHDPGQSDHAAIEWVVYTADSINHRMVNNNEAHALEEMPFADQDMLRELSMTAHQWYPALAEEIEAACHFFLKG